MRHERLHITRLHYSSCISYQYSLPMITKQYGIHTRLGEPYMQYTIYCSLKQILQYIWYVRGEYCDIAIYCIPRLQYIVTRKSHILIYIYNYTYCSRFEAISIYNIVFYLHFRRYCNILRYIVTIYNILRHINICNILQYVQRAYYNCCNI